MKTLIHGVAFMQAGSGQWLPVQMPIALKEDTACSYKSFKCSVIRHFIYDLVISSCTRDNFSFSEMVYPSNDSITLVNGNDVVYTFRSCFLSYFIFLLFFVNKYVCYNPCRL